MTSPGTQTQPLAPASAPHHPTPPDTPRSVVAALRIGGTVSLIAIAVISFDALADLGRLAGLHRLAELFPIAVDAFAASTLYAAYRLPGGHPARALAKRTARSALALTVACNVLDHLLTLAGFLIPVIVRDLVLVVVASLPQLVADREFHLLVAVTASEPERPRPDTDTSLGVSERAADTATLGGLTARDQAWLNVGIPVYQRLHRRDRKRPTERAFHEALTQELNVQTGHAGVLDGSADDSDHLGDHVSLSTAKRVRALVESQTVSAPGPASTPPYAAAADERS